MLIQWSAHVEIVQHVMRSCSGMNQNKILSKSKVQAATKAIISFANSYKYNKKRKQNDKSESTPSITEIATSLQSLSIQIRNNQTCKSVTQIRNLLESLIELTRFRLGTHMTKEEDRLRVGIRSNIQSDLINVEYGKVMTISISTAGGIGEELVEEIKIGLYHISDFLRALHEGRNNYEQPYFPPLPLLARRSKEQIDEEGGNEEIDAQLNNDRDYGNIKHNTNLVKSVILNNFIYSSNQQPGWY
ncbi:MAG: hypothetical protein EZS28_036242 [Streblomastix strix]|uniref:Uncharacterized protein n=1 Tax=Streblomastix strix TaxID=222440 RepID=A0A5J4UE41_9EUKA|nr:MAG: hypothetical protein EZS28_036242 [Streblomastix strix]